jgi:predicted nucleic acid-binding protein
MILLDTNYLIRMLVQGSTPATLQDRIILFTEDCAQEAARLYNSGGRNRRQRVYAMIAATAIVSNAALSTENRGDFLPFVPLGLRMIDHLPQRSYTSSHDR